MIVLLKKNYKANKIAPYIFFVRGTQAPILDTNFHGRSPLWKEHLLLQVWRYIALIQFCLKMTYWAVGQK